MPTIWLLRHGKAGDLLPLLVDLVYKQKCGDALHNVPQNEQKHVHPVLHGRLADAPAIVK